MRKYGEIFCVLLLFGGTLACQSKVVAPSSQIGGEAHIIRQHIIQDISAEQLAHKIKKKADFILVDVREEGEYMNGHVQGAKLIPWMQLRTRYKELDKDKQIILYCHSGRRSKIASTILMHNGFQHVTQMSGGILEWQSKNYPTVTGMNLYAQ